MSGVTVLRESPIVQTGRVMQLSAMFDVPPSEKSELSWNVDLNLDRDWNIGLIVGPSGCGKTSIARDLYGDRLITGYSWDEHKSVVDSFPENMGIKEIVGYLTSVGFSSPPNWLRPYRVLSTGEQFRVTMARALAENSDLCVIDEFTSVVDRQVAQIASNSVQKAIRRANQRMIALSCHYDIVDWLQPDWIYEPHLERFQWRSLQRRPELAFRIFSIPRSAWRLFRQHHYMTSTIHPASNCFGGWLDGKLVAFNAYQHFPHPHNKRIKLGNRLVVLPDYQGLGIGGRFDDWLGEYVTRLGYEYHSVVAHPAMIHHYMNSPLWEYRGTGRGKPGGSTSIKSTRAHFAAVSVKRIVSTFVYKGN